MISVGFDLSAVDPEFKSHAQRGIGRYVTELHRYFESNHDAECDVGYFDHASLRREGLVDRAVSLVPVGRASIRQHLVHPYRLNQGAMRSFSLLHYPAHMDAPALSGKPYVLTVLDLIPHLLRDLYRAHKPGWKFRIARWLEIQSIRRATMLLAISETTASDLVRVLGISRERIVVTPLGVDPSFFELAEYRGYRTEAQRSECRDRFGIPRNRPIVLYVGGHDERKNIGNLIGIVAEVRRERTSKGEEPPILVLAGRVSALHEQLRLESTLRRYDMERDTIVLGYVADSELRDLYCESSLFLFPTLYEGFGLPALEAMASGLPVVSSHTSSLPEVVGDAGLLFDPYSIEAGAREVARVLSDGQLRDSLSRAGATRAREFTWERTGRLTVEGYKRAYSLLSGVSRPAGHKAASTTIGNHAHG